MVLSFINTSKYIYTPKDGLNMPLQRANEIRFSDLDFAFIVHPVTKQLSISREQTAVANSIRNIVLTNQGERPYKSNFGASIAQKLFENFDSIIEHDIRKDIETAIENYEPRADIHDIQVVQEDQQNQNRLRITIIVFVVNHPDPISINFFVERTR